MDWVSLIEFGCQTYMYMYSSFEKGCQMNASSLQYTTRPIGSQGIHWNFAYWCRGNPQICIFCTQSLKEFSWGGGVISSPFYRGGMDIFWNFKCTEWGISEKLCSFKESKGRSMYMYMYQFLSSVRVSCVMGLTDWCLGCQTCFTHAIVWSSNWPFWLIVCLSQISLIMVHFVVALKLCEVLFAALILVQQTPVLQ